MKKLGQDIKKQLLYVKMLLMHGHEHSRHRTDMDRKLAILHFDNAVELLLRCLADLYKIRFPQRKVDFWQLWRRVNKEYQLKTKNQLPQQQDLSRMHTQRTSIQHWGMLTAEEAVQKFKFATEDFISTIFKEAFDLDYKSFSTISLVEDEEVKNNLSQSEEARKSEDYKKSITFAWKAFRIAIEKAEKNLGIRIETIGPYFMITETGIYGKNGEKIPKERQSEAIRLLVSLDSYYSKKINDCISSLSDELLLSMLGIEKQDYTRFRNLALRSQVVPLFEEWGIFTEEEAMFCFNIVLDWVTKWQQLLPKVSPVHNTQQTSV